MSSQILSESFSIQFDEISTAADDFVALVARSGDDKGRTGSYVKLCEFTLLFMNLQLEYRVNKDH